MSQERPSSSMSGGTMFVLHLCGWAVVIGLALQSSAMAPGFGIAAAVLSLFLLATMGGYFTVNPNEGRVMQMFGHYAGTVRMTGLRWANPFMTKATISLRAMSFQSEHMKVNDSDGNPVQIAAIVVYRVVDTAKAAFDVDSVGRYVPIQAEAALRDLAQTLPYDAHKEGELSLRGSQTHVAEQLKLKVQAQVAMAGVEVLDAKISHLAYAPEIAHAMLQRQQASAIIAARGMIVDGAVGMVELALERIARDKIVELDNERKAQMISNLLVVLCGQREAQPVLNTGTIYQ